MLFCAVLKRNLAWYLGIKGEKYRATQSQSKEHLFIFDPTWGHILLPCVHLTIEYMINWHSKEAS